MKLTNLCAKIYFLIFCFCYPCEPRIEINVLYVDDTPTIKKLTKRQVDLYNALADNPFLINYEELSDGNQLTLETIFGKHLIWCDISMPGENGNLAAARITKQAAENSVILPPIIAVTDNLSSAEEQNFLYVRGKIKTQDDIASIFTICQEKLGDYWLDNYMGRKIDHPQLKANQLSSDTVATLATGEDTQISARSRKVTPEELERLGSNPGINTASLDGDPLPLEVHFDEQQRRGWCSLLADCFPYRGSKKSKKVRPQTNN